MIDLDSFDNHFEVLLTVWGKQMNVRVHLYLSLPVYVLHAFSENGYNRRMFSFV